MQPATTETIRDHKGHPIGYIRRQLMTFDEVVDMYGERFNGWFRARQQGVTRGYHSYSEWKRHAAKLEEESGGDFSRRLKARQEDEDCGRVCSVHVGLETY